MTPFVFYGLIIAYMAHRNVSKGAQMRSQNLRGPKHVLKLSSSDTVRVWWVPIVTHGKLHIEALPDNFPGEIPDKDRRTPLENR